MSQSVDETRREFLLRLARASAFVPPAVLTLEVGSALAQGKGAGAVGAPGQEQFGGLSPAASLEPGSLGTGELQRLPGEQQQPWDPGRAAGAPPWSRPPPTQGGPGSRR